MDNEHQTLSDVTEAETLGPFCIEDSWLEEQQQARSENEMRKTKAQEQEKKKEAAERKQQKTQNKTEEERKKRKKQPSFVLTVQERTELPSASVRED